MPHCCASNVKAAFVIGVILAVSFTIDTIYYFTIGDIFHIISGFVGLMSASVLVYGAHTRNSKAIQIYKVSAILMIILFIVETIIVIVTLPDFRRSMGYLAIKLEEKCKDLQGTNDYQVCLNTIDDTVEATGTVTIVVFVLFVIGFTISNIWTIFVGNKAKLEIEDAQRGEFQQLLGPEKLP